MGLAIAAGQANYSSSGANNTSKFIPELWSTRLVDKFYDACVVADISNTYYEGEISGMGDKVIIRTKANISVTDYVKGDPLTYELPQSANVELNIDQAKKFAFELKYVDKRQSDISLMSEWAQDGGEQMKISVDADILGAVYTGAHAQNSGAAAGRISGDIDLGVAATPRVVTKDNIIDAIVDFGTVLDEQSRPESDRFLVLPPRFCGLIKTSDLKDASLTGDAKSTLRNGKTGMIDRFTIYNSNLLNVSGGEHDIIFGHKSALTFAGQIEHMEEVPNPYDFGTLVRSLFAYGYEVIDDKSLGHAVLSL